VAFSLDQSVMGLAFRRLVDDAWRMVVPTTLSRAYDHAHPAGPSASGPL
jgi:hypothetical protein